MIVGNCDNNTKPLFQVNLREPQRAPIASASSLRGFGGRRRFRKGVRGANQDRALDRSFNAPLNRTSNPLCKVSDSPGSSEPSATKSGWASHSTQSSPSESTNPSTSPPAPWPWPSRPPAPAGPPGGPPSAPPGGPPAPAPAPAAGGASGASAWRAAGQRDKGEETEDPEDRSNTGGRQSRAGGNIFNDT
eukprot:3631782-Pyramimonas_sp.AAC.1